MLIPLIQDNRRLHPSIAKFYQNEWIQKDSSERSPNMCQMYYYLNKVWNRFFDISYLLS